MKYIHLICIAAFAFACGESDDPEDPQQNPDPPVEMTDPPAVDPPEVDPPEVDPPEVDPPAADLAGRCVYTNPFSRGTDCKEYVGASWTVESAREDCAAVIGAVAGEFAENVRCEFDAVLGRCEVGDLAADGYVTVSQGDDPTQCGLTKTACEGFAQGTFTNGGTCDSDVCEVPTEVTGTPFVQPYARCVPALAGEPEGATDGEVCTPVVVSGCTEPGRKYGDYGDCDDVRTQRPYAAYGDAPEVDENDPRLADEAYLAELAWVTEEIESCACGCCHTASVTPRGAGAWDTEAGPLWIDMMSDEGVAMMAGLVDSSAFGAMETGKNNGFDRHVTGTPTTDVERMKAFWEAEFARRGKTEEEAADIPPFAGFFLLQEQYNPSPCARGEGVRADGTLNWEGGEARYIYVLDDASASPGVPPNRDLPESTRWQINVGETTPAFACGVTYGEVPADGAQRVPAEGTAEPLVDGETYYLYVQRDVGLPITRCTFEYPVEG